MHFFLFLKIKILHKYKKLKKIPHLYFSLTEKKCFISHYTFEKTAWKNKEADLLL